MAQSCSGGRRSRVEPFWRRCWSTSANIDQQRRMFAQCWPRSGHLLANLVQHGPSLGQDRAMLAYVLPDTDQHVAQFYHCWSAVAKLAPTWPAQLGRISAPRATLPPPLSNNSWTLGQQLLHTFGACHALGATCVCRMGPDVGQCVRRAPPPPRCSQKAGSPLSRPSWARRTAPASLTA